MHAVPGEPQSIRQYRLSPQQKCRETQSLFQSGDLSSQQVSPLHRMYSQHLQKEFLMHPVQGGPCHQVQSNHDPRRVLCGVMFGFSYSFSFSLSLEILCCGKLKDLHPPHLLSHVFITSAAPHVSLVKSEFMYLRKVGSVLKLLFMQ